MKTRKTRNSLDLSKIIVIIRIKSLRIVKNYDRQTVLINRAIAKWPGDIKLLNIALDIYQNNKDWDAFYRAYDRLEKLHPNKLHIKRSLGTALMSSYRYEDALTHLNFCIDKWDLDSTFSGPLANTYARLAICHGYLGDMSMLKITMEKGASIVSWDPDIIYSHLLYYLGTGTSENILGYLDEQIKKYPRLHALYYWKGLFVEYYLHNTQEALFWYQTALEKINYFELRKEYQAYFYTIHQYASPWDILIRAVDACVRLGNSNKAKWLIYKTKLRILDSSINTRLLMVYLHLLNKSFDVAQRKCQAILRRKLFIETETECWYLLGSIEKMVGKQGDALRSASKALNLDNEFYEAWYLLGTIQIEDFDWSSAVETFQKMTEMNRFDFRCWEKLGKCHVEIGNISQARLAFEEAIHLNPTEADALVDLANIYLKLGENDKAVSSYKKALEYAWLGYDRRQHAIKILDQINTK